MGQTRESAGKIALWKGHAIVPWLLKSSFASQAEDCHHFVPRSTTQERDPCVCGTSSEQKLAIQRDEADRLPFSA